MSLPAFSVKNSVLVNMLMVVILVTGGMFAFTLVRELFPESRPDKLAIIAVLPGEQPQEIEKAVTIKVEEAVRDIEGIEKVDSIVNEGSSMTIITLLNEVDDVDAVMQLVKNDVDAIQGLPTELEKITVNKLEPKLPVISVAIFGKGDEAELKLAARQLRDDLLQLPGISNIEITGIRDDEISVEIDPARLLKYDVTFDEVAAAIRLSNLDVSGGRLKGKRSTVAVRALGEENKGQNLEEIVVRSDHTGQKIYVRDLATIQDRFVESDLEEYYNSKRAVSCTVYKTKSQDAIQIATLVKAFVAGKTKQPFDAYGYNKISQKQWYAKPFVLLNCIVFQGLTKLSGRPDSQQVYQESLRSPFDHNFDVQVHTDLARFVEGRLDLMTRNGMSGLVLVLISLNLFLNWRVAFWASIGLPVSFLGTFVLMSIFGATINLISLLGLIIVLGIIVDDAIVIGENIYRHVEEGMPPAQAAVKGAEEVMWPVTVAVLTTIAAFAPLFFVHGQIGDFMGVLPIVVLSALSISLVEALVILPAHLAHLPSKEEQMARKKRLHRPSPFSTLWHGFTTLQQRVMQDILPRWYERFLRFAMQWRYVTIAFSLAALMMTGGMFQGGIVEDVFVQEMDSETLVCGIEMPVGTTADNVKHRVQTISEFVSSHPEVNSVQMFVARQYDIRGAGSTAQNDQTHLGQLVVELKPADERDVAGERSSQQLMNIFREFTKKLPGINSVSWEALNGGPGGKDIVVRVSGKTFLHAVEVVAKLKKHLASYDGVHDLDDNYDKGKREVQIRLRQSAEVTGMTKSLLGHHVRSAIYGQESHRLTRNREDVKVMVRYPEAFRENVYQLESMWIPTQPTAAGRNWVPLREVAELTESEGVTTIYRNQQKRTVTLYGDINNEIATTTDVLTQLNTFFREEIQPDYPDVKIEFKGSFEERTKAMSGLKIAFPVALLLIYMLLAGLFRSYGQPIVVMAAIPFGFLGAIIGHWLTGNPFTILSKIGMVALTGILVNDSLVLVDFINKRIEQGLSPFEASVTGARLRLRAILLTTITTAAGLTPLMFETSFQAKFLIPMVVTMTFGLIFATGLTLVIVPCLNMVYFDVLEIMSFVRGKSKG
ncbi:Acriflavin resistance protein [hydrothermal vent metagenome]|uniref:Acriflavin resistance protein n=1 Tax=hydrothermal vent metagenome TaxID=652676 RepID=A0A3B1DJY6_9ZZZZ